MRRWFEIFIFPFWMFEHRCDRCGKKITRRIGSNVFVRIRGRNKELCDDCFDDFNEFCRDGWAYWFYHGRKPD